MSLERCTDYQVIGGTKQLKTRAKFTTKSTEREESNNHASSELLQSTADLTLISAGLRIDWTKLTVTEATELFCYGGGFTLGTTIELEVSNLQSVLVQGMETLHQNVLQVKRLLKLPQIIPKASQAVLFFDHTEQ